MTRTPAQTRRRSFTGRAAAADRWWAAEEHPLLVTGYPDLDELPERIDVYTDASVVLGKPWAAIGIVCPQLGVVASGVLDAAYVKKSAKIHVAETAAITAGTMLFCESARRVVVHSDSRPALAWWRDPENIPQRWSQLRTYAAREKEAHPNVLTHWVKGHADCEGNLWADRAARLSLHTARWAEDESVRKAKFRNLATEFHAEFRVAFGAAQTTDRTATNVQGNA